MCEIRPGLNRVEGIFMERVKRRVELYEMGGL